MKILRKFIILLVLREISTVAIRKLPTFAVSKFTDSYLPATMQVILHAVDQLKELQFEEMGYSTNILISSSPHPPGLTTWQIVSRIGDDIELTTVSHEIPSKYQTKIQKDIRIVYNEALRGKSELIETSQGSVKEKYQKMEVKPQEENRKNTTKSVVEPSNNKTSNTTLTLANLSPNSIKTTPLDTHFMKNLTSVNQRENLKVYKAIVEHPGLINSTTTVTAEDKKSNKNSTINKLDSCQDENEDTILPLVGERDAQVGRPSLMSYLKRSKIPIRGSLQQLASLYDTLGKDARRQGFATYNGYSDEVLKTLQTTASEGVGSQIRKLLEKTLERNELTQENSKSQAEKTLLQLKDSESNLSQDLKRLHPLRYHS